MTTTIERNINKRFFEALNLVISSGAIRGVNTFCNEHNIDRRNLMKAQKEPEVYSIKGDWMYYLITDFNISADWIITGRGGVFK